MTAAGGPEGDSREDGVRPRTRRDPDTEDVTVVVCELCGGPTKELHCKIVCLNCGFKRDCSDP